MKRPKRFHLFVILILVAAAGAATCWFYLRPRPLDGFAQGNGRIEATEVDIATKFQGRIAEISVDEGDMVDRGQAVARMDTTSLEAQLKQAEANVLQAKSELSNDKFVVAQRKSEYDLAEKNLARAEFLVNKGALSEEEYDIRFAAKQTAKDAIAAAEAQVAVAEARIEAALAPRPQESQNFARPGGFGGRPAPCIRALPQLTKRGAHMRRSSRWIAAAIAALAVGGMAHPRSAQAGFYCRAVKTIPLRRADPTAPVTLTRGFAEIDECLGMSFLRVRVFGNVPDGTAYAIALPAAEPILGDFFSIMGHRADSVIPQIAAATVAGRTIDIVDDGFTPVLTGQF